MPIIRRHFLSLYFWFARKTLSACDIISILSVIFIPVLRVLIRFKYCECFLAIIRFKQLSNCRNLYLHFRCFRFGIFTIFFTHFCFSPICSYTLRYAPFIYAVCMQTFRSEVWSFFFVSCHFLSASGISSPLTHPHFLNIGAFGLKDTHADVFLK